MDLKRYALFVDVADTKNFTKSGNRMGYTQPGVSHVLKTMEKEMGFPLFTRDKHHVCLTPEAERILPVVRELLSVNRRLDNIIESVNEKSGGHLTVATLPSISHSWLPSIITAFRKQYPTIHLELLEGNPEELISWLENYKADIGFLSSSAIGSCSWIPLYQDPMLAILPPDYPTKGLEVFPIQDFENQPFLMPVRSVFTDLPDLLVNHNVHPEILASSRDDLSIMNMVSSGIGLSIMPALSVKDMKYPVKTLPLSPVLTRELGIGYLSDEQLTPAAESFIKLAKKFVADLKKLEHY